MDGIHPGCEAESLSIPSGGEYRKTGSTETENSGG